MNTVRKPIELKTKILQFPKTTIPAKNTVTLMIVVEELTKPIKFNFPVRNLDKLEISQIKIDKDSILSKSISAKNLVESENGLFTELAKRSAIQKTSEIQLVVINKSTRHVIVEASVTVRYVVSEQDSANFN